MMAPHEQEQEQCRALPVCIEILTRLDTNMKILVGNGNPGRIQKIEELAENASRRIGKLERWIWMVTGGGAVIGFLAEKVMRW